MSEPNGEQIMKARLLLGFERARREDGVFVPGLMGAGILLSIVMLITDGVRAIFPVRGDRARAARVHSAAVGRANDLRAVGRGVPPEPARVRHIPRTRASSLVLGTIAAVSAVVVLVATQSYFNSDLIDLAGREEWGFGLGWGAAGLFISGGAIWLSSGALGTRRPEWVARLASLPPFGQLPDLEDAPQPPWLLQADRGCPRPDREAS